MEVGAGRGTREEGVVGLLVRSQSPLVGRLVGTAAKPQSPLLSRKPINIVPRLLSGSQEHSVTPVKVGRAGLHHLECARGHNDVEIQEVDMTV